MAICRKNESREGQSSMERLETGTDASVSENSTNPEAVLNLRVEDLNWQGQQSTSLCDRFQVHMFTEEFEQTEEQVRQTEQQSREEIFADVMLTQEGFDNGEKEQIFQAVMVADTEAVIKFDYTQDVAGKFDISAYLYIFVGILIAGVVFWLVGRRRKKK